MADSENNKTFWVRCLTIGVTALLVSVLYFAYNFHNLDSKNTEVSDHISVCVNVPAFVISTSHVQSGKIPLNKTSGTKGMVWVPAGSFLMGSQDQESRTDEQTIHKVAVDGFWMDKTEVTNQEFARFVMATGYTTIAERTIDVAKEQGGSSVESDNIIGPGSLVFEAPELGKKDLDYSSWWYWVPGADWKHPEGPGSNINGKDHHPVVHIAWLDAKAYAKWAAKRLPTEAEWEWAARGGQQDTKYPWGNQPPNEMAHVANIWQGKFPVQNTLADGFYSTAQVGSYHPNAFGLSDMAGNVWEWCEDRYDANYYKFKEATNSNPTGPAESFDPDEPRTEKRVLRGGSFLCHETYCNSYRSSARMKSDPLTGLSNTGFRCVSLRGTNGNSPI